MSLSRTSAFFKQESDHVVVDQATATDVLSPEFGRNEMFATAESTAVLAELDGVESASAIDDASVHFDSVESGSIADEGVIDIRVSDTFSSTDSTDSDQEHTDSFLASETVEVEKIADESVVATDEVIISHEIGETVFALEEVTDRDIFILVEPFGIDFAYIDHAIADSATAVDEGLQRFEFFAEDLFRYVINFDRLIEFAEPINAIETIQVTIENAQDAFIVVDSSIVEQAATDSVTANDSFLAGPVGDDLAIAVDEVSERSIEAADSGTIVESIDPSTAVEVSDLAAFSDSAQFSFVAFDTFTATDAVGPDRVLGTADIATATDRVGSRTLTLVDSFTAADEGAIGKTATDSAVATDSGYWGPVAIDSAVSAESGQIDVFAEDTGTSTGIASPDHVDLFANESVIGTDDGTVTASVSTIDVAFISGETGFTEFHPTTADSITAADAVTGADFWTFDDPATVLSETGSVTAAISSIEVGVSTEEGYPTASVSASDSPAVVASDSGHQDTSYAVTDSASATDAVRDVDYSITDAFVWNATGTPDAAVSTSDFSVIVDVAGIVLFEVPLVLEAGFVVDSAYLEAFWEALPEVFVFDDSVSERSIEAADSATATDFIPFGIEISATDSAQATETTLNAEAVDSFTVADQAVLDHSATDQFVSSESYSFSLSAFDQAMAAEETSNGDAFDAATAIEYVAIVWEANDSADTSYSWSITFDADTEEAAIASDNSEISAELAISDSAMAADSAVVIAEFSMDDSFLIADDGDQDSSQQAIDDSIVLSESGSLVVTGLEISDSAVASDHSVGAPALLAFLSLAKNHPFSPITRN